nr:sphingoid long chain base kinase 5 [Quercus suber]
MSPTTTRDRTNPFADPAGPDVSPAHLESITDTVLTVDRNATLTLGTDSLIVLDEGLRHRRAVRNACGLLPQFSKTTRAIPFYNVLWAEFAEQEVVIRYARPSKKRRCRVAAFTYAVTDRRQYAHTKAWVEALMERAYPANTKRSKKIKVLINPFGGQGYAQKIWSNEVEPIFTAAQCVVDVEKTAYRGHATEIAERMNTEAVDVVACASGDGLPHEVFNGLAKQKDPRKALRKVAVTQIPCGSGNALSLNVNGTDSPSMAAVAIVKGIRSPLDLVAITQGTSRYYSFLSQAVGIIAETDLGTESLRWMGPFRFTWGILVRLLGQTVYPAEVSLVLESDDKREIRDTYRRTVQEHHVAAAKDLQQEYYDEELPEGEDVAIPALKHGTVADALPISFQTEDLPHLGNFYVGNMVWMSPDTPFFTTALPSDGLMDMISISGLISRLSALRMLTTIEQGTIINNLDVVYRKVVAYRITPRMAPRPDKRRFRATLLRWLGGAAKQKEGLIAIDGERVPFEPFQAEVVPGLGTTLSRHAGLYEFELPKGL